MGTPYTWACAYVMCGTTVMLYGAMRAPTREEHRAIRQGLVDAGVTDVIWERRKPHRAYTVHNEL